MTAAWTAHLNARTRDIKKNRGVAISKILVRRSSETRELNRITALDGKMRGRY